VARCYDASGNQISTSDGRQIDYDIANLPTKIFNQSRAQTGTAIKRFVNQRLKPA